MKVACILDEFSYNCFKNEFDFLVLSRKNWKKELLENQVAFLFTESAWQGNNGEWRYSFNKFHTHNGKDLKELLEFCQRNSIPTVFWNKEDPINYNHFINVAKAFNYIFTTDADIIDKYKEETNNENVFALPFAADIKLHNPIVKRNKVTSERFCFAGAWRGHKYPERELRMDSILKPILDIDKLDIYDRYYDHKDQSLRFPEEYHSSTKGSLPYDKMIKEYKNYIGFLNVNTIESSSTMFSRRVFEILACGTAVISTPSAGIDNLLPGLVHITSSPAETEQHAETILFNKAALEHNKAKAIRTIFREHTYRHRRNTIISSISNLTIEPSDLEPLISVITVSNRPENIDNILKNYNQQNYNNKELCLILNSNEYILSDIEKKVCDLENVFVFQIDEIATLADCLNFARKNINGKYFAKFDDDDIYFENYLTDVIVAFLYSKADIIGKYSFFTYLEKTNVIAVRFNGIEYMYTKHVCGASIAADVEKTSNIPFWPVVQGTDTMFLRESYHSGLKIYSNHKFNYLHIRPDNSKNQHAHTWKMEDEEYLKKCKIICRGMDLSKVKN